MPLDIEVSLPDQTYLMLDEDHFPRLLLTLAKHSNLICESAPILLSVDKARMRNLTSNDNLNEHIVFRLEPKSKTKARFKPQNETAQRISSEISLSLCHELADRLHGQIFTSWTAQGQPTYELRLPAVAVGWNILRRWNLWQNF